MISTKSIEIKKQTATIVVEGEDNYLHNLNRYEISALLLLTGFYNPLRSVSPSDNPIDLEKLKEYKNRFTNLIYDMMKDMDLVVEDIGKIIG